MIQARCDECGHVHGALKIAAKRRVAPPLLFGDHLIRGLFVGRLKARRSMERCQGAVGKHGRS